MPERIAPTRGPQILWFAAACEAVVVCTSLRSGDFLFAGHAVALGCLLAMIAWRGEPARGTRRANLMWGLLVLCGIFLVAAFLT